MPLCFQGRGARTILDDVSRYPTIRKPFDLLAEGLISKKSRGDKTPIELFLRAAASLSLRMRDLILCA